MDQNGKQTTYAGACPERSRKNDADRLISVTDAAQHVTQYAYDDENNLSSITYANNHATRKNHPSATADGTAKPGRGEGDRLPLGPRGDLHLRRNREPDLDDRPQRQQGNAVVACPEGCRKNRMGRIIGASSHYTCLPVTDVL